MECRAFEGMFLVFILTGCLGEDYDLGVPTTHLVLECVTPSVQLTEGNISCSSSSVNVHQTIDDIKKFGLSQVKIKVSANEKVFLDFKENKENGGDI